MNEMFYHESPAMQHLKLRLAQLESEKETAILERAYGNPTPRTPYQIGREIAELELEIYLKGG